jgi:hypothetical protein
VNHKIAVTPTILWVWTLALKSTARWGIRHRMA